MRAVPYFGLDVYGRVDAVRGEAAWTEFFHAAHFPLFPTRSAWGARGGSFEIRLHARSIAATYLRWWGPVAAAIVLAAAPFAVGIPIAVVLAAAIAWTLRWRDVPEGLPTVRADYNRLAFGTWCEHDRLADDVRDHFERWYADAWRKTVGVTPRDVVRFGARDLREAVLAYGALRLAGDDALADALILGVRREAPSGDGPYREGTAQSPEELYARVLQVIAHGHRSVMVAPSFDATDDTAEPEPAWTTRRVCPDGACTGLLGDDDRCRVCGVSAGGGDVLN